MRWIRLILVMPAMAVFAGCYHYVPAPTLVYPQGTPVRANLDSLQAFELAAITVNYIDRVEGEMVRLDGGDLVLSATWLQAVTGNGFAGNGWTVRIPEQNVTGIELKRVDWWRTGVMVGGFAIVTWFGFDALGIGPAGGEGGSGPGPIH